MQDVSTLIERWRQGDQRAAQALYDRHSTPVLRLAIALLGNEPDAEEAAQDALTYALVHIERFDPGRASFRTWLHTIAVSRCRDRMRRRKWFAVPLSHWLARAGEIADPHPLPEQETIRRQQQDEIQNAIRALSHPLREAIVLRYWGGHTYPEIAQIIGRPASTARSRVRLAYAQIRKTLAGAVPTDVHEETAV